MKTHKLNGKTILWVDIMERWCVFKELIDNGAMFISTSKDMNEDNAYNLGCTIGLFRPLEQSLNIDPNKNYVILIADTQI